MLVTVSVKAEIFRDADRLARERCLQSLEETLAEFAHDMAETWNRPGSWEACRVMEWMNSHYPPVEVLKEWREEERQKRKEEC